jgi:hypothetical protein
MLAVIYPVSHFHCYAECHYAFCHFDDFHDAGGPSFSLIVWVNQLSFQVKKTQVHYYKYFLFAIYTSLHSFCETVTLLNTLAYFS